VDTNEYFRPAYGEVTFPLDYFSGGRSCQKSLYMNVALLDNSRSGLARNRLCITLFANNPARFPNAVGDSSCIVR